MSFVSDIVGSLVGADSDRHAANQQKDAAMASDATQRYFYDTARSDNQPLLAARNSALAGYQNLLANPSGVTSDPGYRFTFDEGMKGLDRSAASHGALYSGAALKDAQRFGQNLASTKLDALLGRYSTLAGLGQPGAAAISSAGMNAANSISGNQQNLGNALAASGLSTGTRFGNALSSIGAYGQKKGWFDSTPTVGGGIDPNGYLGGAATAGDYSDARLKTNIRHVGITERGHQVYTWDWKSGGSGIGVIAQEVLNTNPAAVSADSNGFLMVDYSKV